MAVRFTLGDYLISRLKEVGVDHAFGVPGDYLLDFLYKMEHATENKVEFVNTCNELNASYAADGYARIKGIGCIMTTFGVGELSAINGIAGCYAERVPVIAVTGAPTLKSMAHHTPYHHTVGNDYKKFLRMFEEVTVASTYLVDPETAPKEIDRVITECVFHSRPAYIAIPQDLVDKDCERPSSPLCLDLEHSNSQALEFAIKEITELINKAKHPVLLADFEVVRFRLQGLLQEIVDKTKIPFATTPIAKGALWEDHPQYVGVYHGVRSVPEVKDFVEKSDCIVFFGNLPTDFNTGIFTDKIPTNNSVLCKMHHVEIQSETVDQVRLVDIMKGLRDSLHERPAMPDLSRLREVRKSDSTPPSDQQLTQSIKLKDIFDRVSRYMPENAILIGETGCAAFGLLDTKFPKGGTFIAQLFYSSIGYSVGAALGACIAAPNRKVVLFVGDGSFQLTCQEVSTMLKHKANITIFLINNDGYTTERLIKDGSFNDVVMWNYTKFPEIFGGREGVRVETIGQLEDCARECTSGKKGGNFSFVELRVERMDMPECVKRQHALTNASELERSTPIPSRS